MRVDTVKSSFITTYGCRLDGSFHLSDGIKVRAMIKNSPYGVVAINSVAPEIYCPGIFHRNYTTTGTPFLGGGDILKQDYDSGKYLVRKTTPNYKILEIQRGWTLVTCGGTIGNVVFTNKELSKCWVSQHVMRVIPKDIKEGMLYAYLASNYGHLLLTTDTYGSVIPTLNASSIGLLPIPKFPEEFQKEVDGLVQESARLREEAADALAEVRGFFDTRLSLSSENKISCRVSIKSILSSQNERFEANYHCSEGAEYTDLIISKFQYEPLSSFFNEISRLIFLKECM